MSGKKGILLAAVLLLALTLAVGGYFYSQKTTSEPAAAPTTEKAPEFSMPQAAIKATDFPVKVKGGDATKPRQLGDDNAPVTLVEHASFTCIHCGTFHETVFPILLRDYVATGKVKIIVKDFPLNREAMDATLLSRCVIPDQYINFTSAVFANVATWSASHPQALKEMAALVGLSPSDADTCLNDKKVEEAIISDAAEAQQKFEIASTPSFVINDDKATVIRGAQPVDVFKAALDKALSEKK